MAKKQVKSVPPMYQELDKTPAKLRLCLMLAVDGILSTFQSRTQLEGLKSYEELIKPSIDKVWDNFDQFLDQNEQTILTYHANYFGAEPPKGQDKITTASLTWYKMVANAKNNMATGTPVSETGRKSTILNRKYFAGEVTEGSADVKTFQALACLKIFRETLEKSTDEIETHDGDGKLIKVKAITEEVLKQAVNDRAGEIKTRQDPWRIFQYYRPTLIKAKLVRHN